MPEYYELLSKSQAIPSGADFCFVMAGDEMEPVIKQGAQVFVCRRESPGQMEVGLFYHKGRVYCRQYCEDYAGDIHLLCANPRREDMNLHFRKAQEDRCLCLGRVLLKNKPPMPVYL